MTHKTNLVKFKKGSYENYDPNLNRNIVYLAEDKKEIIMNGNSYSGKSYWYKNKEIRLIDISTPMEPMELKINIKGVEQDKMRVMRFIADLSGITRNMHRVYKIEVDEKYFSDNLFNIIAIKNDDSIVNINNLCSVNLDELSFIIPESIIDNYKRIDISRRYE